MVVQQRSPAVRRRDFLSLTGRGVLLVPAAGASVSVVLSACGGGQGSGLPAGARAQTVMTPLGFLMSYIEMYVANEEGFWEAEGLQIDIQGGQGTATAIQAVLGGSANYARAGGISSIESIANEGIPLVNIATLYQTSQFNLASIGTEPLSPGDLRRKSIGVVSSGGTTEKLLLVMLASAGIDPSSVERPVVGTGAAALELAKRGEVDGWIALADDLAVFRQDGEEVAALNTNDVAFVPADSYVAPRQLLDRTPDLAERFLAGLLAAVDFMLAESNTDKVIDHARKYSPEIDPEQARIVVPELRKLWVAAGEDQILLPSIEDWDKGQRNVSEAGLIKNTVPVEQLVDPSFIEAVKGG